MAADEYHVGDQHHRRLGPDRRTRKGDSPLKHGFPHHQHWRATAADRPWSFRVQRPISAMHAARFSSAFTRRLRYAPPTELNTHNTLYPQLSPALAAFYSATQELGMALKNVTTFTESISTAPSRSTTGAMAAITAWGGHHLVLGGAVKGGPDLHGRLSHVPTPADPTIPTIRGTLDPVDRYRSIRRNAMLMVRHPR